MQINSKHLGRYLNNKYGSMVSKELVVETLNSPQFEKECNISNAILELVCAQFDLKLEELKSRTRVPLYVYARYIYFYLMNKHSMWIRVDIGEVMGVNHTTVLHGITMVRRAIKSPSRQDRDLINELNEIEKKLQLCGYL